MLSFHFFFRDTVCVPLSWFLGPLMGGGPQLKTHRPAQWFHVRFSFSSILLELLRSFSAEKTTAQGGSEFAQGCLPTKWQSQESNTCLYDSVAHRWVGSLSLTLCLGVLPAPFWATDRSDGSSVLEVPAVLFIGCFPWQARRFFRDTETGGNGVQVSVALLG